MHTSEINHKLGAGDGEQNTESVLPMAEECRVGWALCSLAGELSEVTGPLPFP